LAERAAGIPVVVAGLGEIGRAVVRALAGAPDLRLVGAVDPAFAGRKLDDLTGVPGTGLVVEGDPARPLAAARGGVLLQATTSRAADALPQIEQAVKGGVSVATACEELAWPWLAHEEEADALDALCDRHDVAVVGTGVNPGFALDRLPALLSQCTGPVRHVSARRVVDLATRRAALRRKAGVGLSPEEFLAAADAGRVGHVGLAESAMIAALGCGLELDEVEEEIEPVVAARDLAGPEKVARGRVAGARQLARGWAEGREAVRLELVLAVGAEDPRDEVRIDADPPLSLVVPGGLPGEAAAAWALVHAARALPVLRGLVTVLDLPSGRA
jgi:4-hydroxy-tetrahydrodipicolinate reductase